MQPNPLLQQLAVLIGEWTTLGTHPLLPGRTFHGHTSFEWLEGGAFLLARMHIDEPEVPDGIAVFGTDDASPNSGSMLYFDVRNVSREYAWTSAGNALSWSRDTAEFSQRMQLTIADDLHSIAASGSMSRNGGAWEPDLQLDYTRAG